MKYKGYIITQARKTGGKAGKGNNKTSTIQVYKDDGSNCLLKQIVFTTGATELVSRLTAIHKAEAWIEEELGNPEEADRIRRENNLRGAGGKQKGAGRPAEMEDGAGRMVYLDEETKTFFSRLGDGNLSAGIRKGREILRGDRPLAILRR